MDTSKIAEITTRLTKQVDTYIDKLELYNDRSPNERRRAKGDYKFLRDFYLRFFTDRNLRAVAVLSPEYKEVAELARKQFPVSTYWNLCMDGRVKTVLTNGATAGVGASIRVPGGILREFVRGSDGKFKLLKTSNFALLLTQALNTSDRNTIAEIFDSHVGCAARGVEEEARGRALSDSGLLSDVLHKKEMLQAMEEFVREMYGGTKKVIAIQTSFDPHEGYLYMGLETEVAIAVAKSNAVRKTEDSGSMHRWEYGNDELDALVSSEKVISTKQLANNEVIAKIFDKYAFPPKWATDYVLSAKHFWESIASMSPDVLPVIHKKLLAIYPHLENKNNKTELNERAMILLSSAFIYYIHNLDGKYPYSEHREECIKISRGGYPPYEISAFVLLGSDEKNLSANIELSALLVRKNRTNGRVVDRSHTFQDKGIFSQAPIPLIVQEVLDVSLDYKEWDFLADISWEDLPDNWDALTDREFFSYLESKGDIHIKVAIGLNNLRRRMAILFDPDQVTAGRMVSHHKVAIPVMVDKNRINHFLVPFVKLGF
jgi:hypothetical protein